MPNSYWDIFRMSSVKVLRVVVQYALYISEMYNFNNYQETIPLVNHMLCLSTPSFYGVPPPIHYDYKLLRHPYINVLVFDNKKVARIRIVTNDET